MSSVSGGECQSYEQSNKGRDNANIVLEVCRMVQVRSLATEPTVVAKIQELILEDRWMIINFCS